MKYLEGGRRRPTRRDSGMEATARQESLAARTIQAWARRCKSGVKQPAFRFPTMAELKAKFGQYFDSAALAAGADDAEFYTAPAIMAREAVRQSSEVVEALDHVWQIGLEASITDGLAVNGGITRGACECREPHARACLPAWCAALMGVRGVG